MPRTFEDRLAELRREIGPPRIQRRPTARTRKSARTRWVAVGLGVLKVAFVIALPFVLYVKTTAGLYLYGHASAWGSVLGGALITLAIAATYAAWLSRKFSGKKRAVTWARWVALPSALAWCLYAALYLSGENAKSEQVRQYYRSVHPVLRVALATAILGDPDVVITDARRVPEDYARMGLPINDRTKHYVQSDGWVHAADLRTNGHGEPRNRALQLYFWSMGFSTLRHVGTADHLHVQLPVR